MSEFDANAGMAAPKDVPKNEDQQPQVERCRSLFPVTGIGGLNGIYVQCDLGRGHAQSHRHARTDQAWHDETDGAMFLSYPSLDAMRKDRAVVVEKTPAPGFVTGERLQGHTTKGLCAHKVVTVTEDGGRCNACGADLEYNPVSRNWIPVGTLTGWATPPTEADRVRGFRRCNEVARIPSLSSEPLRCCLGRGHSGGCQFSPDYPDSHPEPLHAGPLPETIADKEPTRPVNLYPVKPLETARDLATVTFSGPITDCVREALGMASMCWENPYKGGVFDSDRALIISEALLTRIWEGFGEHQSEAIAGLKQQIELMRDTRQKQGVLLDEVTKQRDAITEAFDLRKKRIDDLEKWADMHISAHCEAQAAMMALTADRHGEAGPMGHSVHTVSGVHPGMAVDSSQHPPGAAVFDASMRPEPAGPTRDSLNEERRTMRVRALQEAINRYSMESLSNTPDFILAEWLMTTLEGFAAAIVERERWYGRGGEMKVNPVEASLPQPVMTDLAKNWMDRQIITGENIGGIRNSLFMPFDCEWNGWVRDETAKREGKGVR